jgi:hypothetical protein
MSEIWNQSKRNEENSGEISAICDIKMKENAVFLSVSSHKRSGQRKHADCVI